MSFLRVGRIVSLPSNATGKATATSLTNRRFDLLATNRHPILPLVYSRCFSFFPSRSFVSRSILLARKAKEDESSMKDNVSGNTSDNITDSELMSIEEAELKAREEAIQKQNHYEDQEETGETDMIMDTVELAQRSDRGKARQHSSESGDEISNKPACGTMATGISYS